MKTAIIIVGNVRTWEKCKDNFVSTFGTEVDIFVSTYNRQYAYHPFIRQSLNFHEDFDLSEDRLQQMFSGLNLRGRIIDDIDTYVESRVKPRISSKYPRDAHLSLAQYFKLNDAIGVMKKYEESMGFVYDRVIKTRFDVTYNVIDCPRQDCVYVDGSGAGVFPCDWIFVTNRNTAVSINDFIVSEMQDMQHQSSLTDMPHKLFLNGISSSTKELCLAPLINSIVRAR